MVDCLALGIEHPVLQGHINAGLHGISLAAGRVGAHMTARAAGGKKFILF
jgi:hypothetical protein